MALENTTYIDGLVPSNPLSTDTVAQADDHIRLIKAALKATFPNITGPVTATQAQINTPIPTGVIVMWSGSVNSIPSGWYLCNGSNGTPNLTDRFIVGAGSAYAVGVTGGANEVTLSATQIPAHTHDITASTSSAGAHSHTLTDPGHAHSYTTVTGAGGIGGGYNYGQSGTSTGSAVTNISVNSGGAHTHSVTATASSVGGGLAHENRPPYYALAYIMKA